MKTQHDTTKFSASTLAAYAACSVLLLTRCTQQIPSEFLLQQQNETFTGQTKVQINTKIDLLWVVDNSSSMDVEQKKLRDGFAAFAQKYMQPTWDIHLAVIPTDVYLAAPEFNSYLNTTITGSTGYASTYIDTNFSAPGGGHPFINPPGNANLATWNGATSKWVFTNGIKLKDFVPQWGNNYGTLQAGIYAHDGPIAALCSEYFPYFLWGQTLCPTRDANALTSGNANCLAGGNSSNEQCVNTLENNSVHSGQPIISTLGGNTQTLINNFTINMTTGTSGHGSERGMQSVLELLTDNENAGSTTKFFRPGSTRGIIFVSDEEDQTMPAEPTPYPAGYNPWTHYMCDQAGLVAANPGLNISGAGGVCCAGGSCQYGAEGTTCAAKTVDSTTFTLSVCPNPAKLMPVATVKTTLDNFFKGLDGSTSNPNYFVTAIVPASGNSISAIQTARNTDDQNVITASTAAGGNEGLVSWSADRGDRYIQLSQSVTPGAQALDLNSADYSGVLDAIGQELTKQKGTFTLARAPTSQEQTIVEVVHADGSITVINKSQYSLSGNILTITDINVILTFVSTDQIVINYQPLTSV